MTDLHEDILRRHDKVLIVDFGSQVTQLIARRVREAGVYCEIAPFQSAEKAFESHPAAAPSSCRAARLRLLKPVRRARPKLS